MNLIKAIRDLFILAALLYGFAWTVMELVKFAGRIFS